MIAIGDVEPGEWDGVESVPTLNWLVSSTFGRDAFHPRPPSQFRSGTEWNPSGIRPYQTGFRRQNETSPAFLARTAPMNLSARKSLQIEATILRFMGSLLSEKNRMNWDHEPDRPWLGSVHGENCYLRRQAFDGGSSRMKLHETSANSPVS
jgi:hypothetical protein